MIKQGLFEGVLKWNIGIEFQVGALQAVMAELIDGVTIHHALGIPVFGKKGDHDGESLQKQMDLAKRFLQWRFLIIDEISMVSARLLTDIDTKLRQLVRQLGTKKTDDTKSSGVSVA